MDLQKIKRIILFISCGVFLIQCASEHEPGSGLVTREFGVTEDFRIGDPNGKEEYLFGEISKVSVSEGGEIYIYDSQLPSLRKYSSEGEYIRKIGREGRGPGEFISVTGMDIIQGNKLAVFDNRLLRIQIFDQTGELTRIVTGPRSFFSAHVFDTDTAGNFYTKITLERLPNLRAFNEGWRKYSPVGEIMDTLRIPPQVKRDHYSFVLFTSQGTVRPFLERTESTLSSFGYLISGNNTSYKIILHKEEGTDTLSRPYHEIPLHEEERKQWTDFRNSYSLNFSIPDVKPVFKAIYSDSEGKIWVWRYSEAESTDIYVYGENNTWWERPTFDVFLPDGSFYGTVTLPFNATFIDSRGDKLWAVTQDRTGEYLTRYTLSERNKVAGASSLKKN